MKKEKHCSNCLYWSRHVCVDKNNQAVRNTAKLSEPFWYYEECKKNWGLPKLCHTSAAQCNFYKENT